MTNHNNELVLKFDPNTIEHLGISLYSKLPSVISELISNSWDADADKVQIDFIDSEGKREVSYTDDGEGMSFSELNEKYLLIGRNRRMDDGDKLTGKGRRVIGKKGLGKLAVFGICDEVTVRTVKNGIKNHFVMNLQDIKKEKGSYKPFIIAFDEKVDEESGTKIWLKKIRRKSIFKPDDIALGLSKKFLIFDQIEVFIKHNEDNPFRITNERKFEGFNIEFEWKFPDNKYDEEYEHWMDVTGKIITLETPLKDTEMRGIYLTSRGKIVNVADFYGLRDTDQFHGYVTGYLEVDFIDHENDELISTDRQSINWEFDVSKDLQNYLQTVIKKVGNEWREKRKNKKTQNVKKSTGTDIETWQKGLVTYERELAQKIVNPILENSNIDVEESGEIIDSIIDKFNNKDFKEYASHIADNVAPDEIHKFLTLMNEWKTLERKQISDLAISRVEVIKKFEEYLSDDTKEVPTLHDFLKRFSWLLDPRILEFKDEVTYSSVLVDNFPDDKLEEANRRIDFLCSNALGGVLYVIEIKRSKYKIDAKALEQVYEYGAFLMEKYATESGFSNVVCFIVGGEKSSNYNFRAKEKTYRNSGEVFVKTYRELLEQSRQYHKEFIEAYEKDN